MCITFFYINPRASKNEYRLIIVANRDEFFNRQSTTAHHWKENPTIIGGRDLESISRGTWLAASVKGKIGILLNVDIKLPNADAVSRGVLISDFLKEDTPTSEFCKTLTNDQRLYNGFHLILFDLTSNVIKAYIQSNIADGKISEPKELENGCHGCSNYVNINLPYKKVINGKRKFEDIIQKYSSTEQRDELINELLELAKSKEKHYPDEVLFESKRRVMDREYIERLSSVFVSVPEKHYGTRTHTIIMVTQDNYMDFNEYTMNEPIDYKNPEWVHSHYFVKLEN